MTCTTELDSVTLSCGCAACLSDLVACARRRRHALRDEARVETPRRAAELRTTARTVRVMVRVAIRRARG